LPATVTGFTPPQDCQILPAELGDDAGVLGCAAMVLQMMEE